MADPFLAVAAGTSIDRSHIHMRNNYGQTLLHAAAKYGRADTVCMLLRSGVNAAAIDHYGMLAESYASVPWIQTALAARRRETLCHYVYL